MTTATTGWGQTYGDRLMDLIAQTDAARPRSQQTVPGISELGGCERAVAYKTHGTEPSDLGGFTPSAMLGTWLHEVLLPLMAEAWNGLHSVKIRARWPGLPEVPGEADLVLPLEHTVVDLKTGSENKMQRVVRDGEADWRHRIQTHTYTHWLREALGMDLRWVTILYLGRSRGEHATFTEPFDPEIVEEGRRWYARVVGYDRPEDAPRGEPGPGLSVVCDGCPFRTRCWPNAQATLADEGGSAAVASALEGYAEAAARKAAAEKDQDFFKAILVGTEPGEYGPFRLSWQRPRTTLDQREAKAMLAGLGLEPPVRVGSPVINVKRVV